MTEPHAPRRGRKRSEQSRLAILTATFELTRDEGYRALTVEGIAARAGVGKQTVYRWWPTKADVLLEALATKAELHVSVADRGSFRADLEQFLRDSFALLGVPGVAQALRSLMAEAQVDSQFASRFREGFLDRRRAALAELLQRARRRGDAPPVADELVADVVFGVIWYRVLATNRPWGEADLVALRDLLTSTFTNPDPSSRIGSTHV
ncbi:TetR/AcrR family transcriptional regulator [Thermocrispum municipale]|uniref:TetR/AcrR family transcriptional regulator n=1 Tax=Thermocrispum municipale TaxID=37926 RepID=UPI000402E096|nr:TetR/AcrR family transcriptional regulator [Thermocrispum municipale]